MSNCNRCNPNPCSCHSTCNTCEDDCPIQLDFGCIIYNKFGRNASNLNALNLPNGSTLKLVVESIDEKLRQSDVKNTALPFLKADHTINTLSQFAAAVDSELAALSDSIGDVTSPESVNISATSTPTIGFTASGHSITGHVKVSAQSKNKLSALADGLFAGPQTLIPNYSTKTLTISEGNTVDLSGMFTAPSGYLGNVANDPSSTIDGTYWFNTSQNKLKIKVNGVVKEIPTI